MRLQASDQSLTVLLFANYDWNWLGFAHAERVDLDHLGQFVAALPVHAGRKIYQRAQEPLTQNFAIVFSLVGEIVEVRMPRSGRPAVQPFD